MSLLITKTVVKGLSKQLRPNGVTILQLNNPQRKNAITTDMFTAITDELYKAGKDEFCKLVVLTGTGDYYCSGQDLSNFAVILEGKVTPAEAAATGRQVLGQFQAAFIDFPKPLIAAVNGPAIGIAVTPLLLCDCVLAVDTATFSTPFIQTGQAPEGASTWTFPLMLGPLLANDMMLFGRTLTANEAQRCGLVSRVFPAATFQAEVDAFINHVLELPTETLQAAKAVLRSKTGLMSKERLHAASQKEVENLEQQWQSEDCVRAIGSFLTRRGAKL